MLTPPLTSSPLRDERGFTLVEVLVAMVTGLVVTGALFAILDISVKQSARISEAAQSTQLARGTMTRIQDELHSACISPKFVPVRPGSTESKLILYNAYSEKAEVPATWTVRETSKEGVKKQEVEGLRKDEIVWSEAAKTLVDNYSPGAGESKGEYTFGAAKSIRIGENISLVPNPKYPSEKPEKLPVFQYYKFATAGTSATSEASTTLSKVEPPATGLTVAESAQIVAVGVTFNTAPNDSTTTAAKRIKEARTADLNSMSTLSFSAPDAESTISGGPCE